MQPDNPGPSNNAATADAMRMLPLHLVTQEFDFNATSLISHPLKLRFQPRPTPSIRKKTTLRFRHHTGLVERPDLSSGLLLTIYSPGCELLSGASGALPPSLRRWLQERSRFMK